MHHMRVVGVALTAVLMSGCAWVGRVGVTSAGVQPGAGTTVGTDVSRDGRYVMFTSDATNLVAGDTNNARDVFWHDNQTGATERVSVTNSGAQANIGGYDGKVSADGRYVAFSSDATNLVGSDTNGVTDVFVRDRVTATTKRVSVRASGLEGDDASRLDGMSPDGNLIVFSSDATNLIGLDENFATDVFIRDRGASITTRVSVASDGSEGDAESYGGSISDDGRYVAFISNAWNFDVNDSGTYADVFVRDQTGSTTTRVTGLAGGDETDDESYDAQISGNGGIIAFSTDATNLIDPADDNIATDVYATVRGSGTFERISVAADGGDPDLYSFLSGISDDGRFVLFQSGAHNLVTKPLTAVSNSFVRDRSSATTAFVGTTQKMEEPKGATIAASGSSPNAMSGDGRYVLFSTAATDVLVTGDANGGALDVYLRSNPVPFILFASPTTIGRGTSATIALHGSAFRAAGALVLMGDGVAVNSVTAVGEIELDVNVTVSADAPVGPRTPFIVESGTGAGAYTGGVVFLADAFSVI